MEKETGQAKQKSEQRVDDCEQRYQVMVEAIPDGIVRLDSSGAVEYLNPAGERLYGLVRRSLLDQKDDPGLGTIDETLRVSVFESGEEALLEYNLPTNSGLQYIRARYLPEFSDAGDVISVLCILSDITGRRRVEEALHASMLENQRQQELLREIFDTNPGGMAVLVGKELEHQFVNAAYRQLTPHPQIDPTGRLYSDVWPPQEEFRGSWLIQRALHTGKPVHLDRYPQAFPDGSTRYFSLDIRRIPWSDQPAVLLVLWDMTQLEEAYRLVEASAAEARLRAEEAEEREVALQVLTRQLERSNRDLQDFAFIASHDLKEPLRKIQSFGELLKNGFSPVLGERGADYIQRMQDASLRMQKMIEDLLNYSRVSTHSEPFVSVDLRKLAGEVMDDLDERIQDLGGKVELDELPVIEADPRQMRQLLQNLITNALKFHRRDVPPVVRVWARSAGEKGNRGKGEKGIEPAAPAPGTVQILVEDNGIGFQEEYLERIFQPFQRLHGRSQYEGSGIGLAICRKIVERHGGSITATSQPGAGSVFTVSLPALHQR